MKLKRLITMLLAIALLVSTFNVSAKVSNAKKGTALLSKITIYIGESANVEKTTNLKKAKIVSMKGKGKVKYKCGEMDVLGDGAEYWYGIKFTAVKVGTVKVKVKYTLNTGKSYTQTIKITVKNRSNPKLSQNSLTLKYNPNAYAEAGKSITGYPTSVLYVDSSGNPIFKGDSFIGYDQKDLYIIWSIDQLAGDCDISVTSENSGIVDVEFENCDEFDLSPIHFTSKGVGKTNVTIKIKTRKKVNGKKEFKIKVPVTVELDENYYWPWVDIKNI